MRFVILLLGFVKTLKKFLKTHIQDSVEILIRIPLKFFKPSKHTETMLKLIETGQD